MKNKIIKLLGFFSLLISQCAFSYGQGLYLKINSDIAQLGLRVGQAHCVDNIDKIGINKRIYLKSDIFSPGEECYVDFSLLDSHQLKVAAYHLSISIFGSTLKRTYWLGAPYVAAETLYPRYSFYPINSQDQVVISISNKNIEAWMASIAKHIRDKKINQIFMPGTHDSGTYLISADSALTADASKSLRLSQKYSTEGIRIFNAGWAKTQSNDILQQLNSGIRYFDLRLCGKSIAVEDVYACHGLQGDSLKSIINQVKIFLRQAAHQYEIIILDIHHWYVDKGNDLSAMQKNTLAYINEQLSLWIAPRKDASGVDQYTASSTLAAFWDQHKQVIIAASELPSGGEFNDVWQEFNTRQEHFQDCSAYDLCSYWPNKQNADQLKKSIKQTIQHLKQRQANDIFVLQAQLSPSKKIISHSMLSPTADNLLSYTGTYKEDIYDLFRKEHILKEINGAVIIEDFSNGIDLTLLALELNTG
jgi:hypothetical protein